MKTIQMNARRAFRYAGRALVAGDSFEARNAADAMILSANGNAKRAKSSPAATPEPKPETQVAAPQVRPIPQYRTRVMTAEPPPEVPQSPPLVTKDASAAPADALDAMDADVLRELAERRGIPVHYRAGPEKLRAAIREAAQDAAKE